MRPRTLRPLDELPVSAIGGLVGVLTDIDDTLTTDGRLPAAAYQALERLADAGLAVVSITGRPAGWCDMIARFWPVAGVVGENGAFYFAYDRGRRRMLRRFADAETQRAANRIRLGELARTILDAVPEAAIAADQLYRETDLAIDICEDIPPLAPAQVDRILQLFDQAGATAKVSSIHVNGWFGSYDKLTMTRHFVADILGRDLAEARERFVYVGDSPNDSPMFAYFPYACGVANVRELADRMPALPAFVAPSAGGQGFVEIAEAILRHRTGVEAPA